MRSLRSSHAASCAAVALLLACTSPPGGPWEPSEPGDLVIAPRVATVASGRILKFKATTYDADGRATSLLGASWSILDAAVARIGQDGTLVAGQAGTTRVIARWNGAQAEATVTVYIEPVEPGCPKLSVTSGTSNGGSIPCPSPGSGPGRGPVP